MNAQPGVEPERYALAYGREYGGRGSEQGGAGEEKRRRENDQAGAQEWPRNAPGGRK